jgi:hypothetical protein
VAVVTEVLKPTPSSGVLLHLRKTSTSATFVRIKFERCAERLRDGFLQ